MSLQAQSLVGVIVLPFIAWVLSERRVGGAPHLTRVIVAGLVLQFAIAGLLLAIPASRAAFDWAAGLVAALQAATNAGMRLVFGYLAGGRRPSRPCGRRPASSWPSGAPLILVISALSRLLYHWGVLQVIVRGVGWVLQRSFGIRDRSARRRRPTSSWAWWRRRC